MRSGTALTQLVEFTDGFPDGDISWTLLDGAGAEVANGTVTPVAASASAVITVVGADNTLAGGVLTGSRELSWSYTVGGILHNGVRSYLLEAFLPLGVSREGVRHKLGVEEHELEDEAIDLAGAYSRFQETVGSANLTAIVTAGGHSAMLARDAVEALCAIALIPSIQVSLAAKESSGTDQYQRNKIDWEMLRAQLSDLVAQGYVVVDPTLDPTLSSGSLLVVAVRDDPIVGEAAG